MMSKIDDLIESLPEEIRPIALKYAPILVNLAVDEIRAWVELIMKGEWQPAYRYVARKMSTEDLLAEHKRINENFKALNRENIEFIRLQKEIVRELLEIALKIAVTAAV